MRRLLFFRVYLREFRACIVDEALGVFDDFFAGGLFKDVVLLETFVDCGRYDCLDV